MPDQQDWRVVKVAQILKEDPLCRAPQLAKVVGLSQSRLQHLFQHIVGISLGTYRQECQLQCARRLLANPAIPLKQIRSQCGIPDATNFIRFFKRRFGVTPGTWRKSIPPAVSTAK